MIKLRKVAHLKYLFHIATMELGLYLVLFYTINVLIRTQMTEAQKDFFGKVKILFHGNLEAFSRALTFLLGFYVSLVVKRWWDQYMLLPWPDDLAIALTGIL